MAVKINLPEDSEFGVNGNVSEPEATVPDNLGNAVVEDSVPDENCALVTIGLDGVVEQFVVPIQVEGNRRYVESGFSGTQILVRGGHEAEREGVPCLFNAWAKWETGKGGYSHPVFLLPEPGKPNPFALFLECEVAPADEDAWFGLFPASSKGVRILTPVSKQFSVSGRQSVTKAIASAFLLDPDVGQVALFRGNQTGALITVEAREDQRLVCVEPLAGNDLIVVRVRAAVELAKKKNKVNPDLAGKVMADAFDFLQMVPPPDARNPDTSNYRRLILEAMRDLLALDPKLGQVWGQDIQAFLANAVGAGSVLGYANSGFAGRHGLFGADAEEVFDATFKDLEIAGTFEDRSKILAMVIELIPDGDHERALAVVKWMGETTTALLWGDSPEATFYAFLWNAWGAAAVRAGIAAPEVETALNGVRQNANGGIESGSVEALRTHVANSMHLSKSADDVRAALVALDTRTMFIPGTVWAEFFKVWNELRKHLDDRDVVELETEIVNVKNVRRTPLPAKGRVEPTTHHRYIKR